jgi:methylated-DNA-protein-cysteine methyltransferase-like protein
VTDFKTDVYYLVNSIPEGMVLTYGAVAALLGRPGNSRQVGRLMSCAPAGVRAHRVVNAAGRTAPGWIEQRDLLEGEGVAFRENGTVDLKRHLYRIPNIH